MFRKAKNIFILFFLIIIAFYINLIVSTITPNLPKPGEKPTFYSNQMRQDLKMTILRALKIAKKSIYLVMYDLTDPHIKDILNKKSENGLNIKVFIDKNSFCNLDIKPYQITKVKSKGLMHQKILIIDGSLVFLGSANMTTSSLIMHDNLIVSFYSPEIAKFLTEKAPFSASNTSSMIGGQKIEVWLLPDFQNSALGKVKNLIDSATSSVEVAMFTFTHPILTEALIKAKNRGLKVKVAIDFQSKNGVSNKTIEKLQKENIEIYSNSETKLCHHKFISIDNKTLICGSANWTKSAFNNNHDCFFILYDLDLKQKEFLKKLWKIIQLESSLLQS